MGLVHGDITEQINGAYYDVFNGVPYDQPEQAYGNAMVIAMRERGLQFVREPAYPLAFRGEWIGDARPDFVVERKVVVEIKAVDRLLAAHERQLKRYLEIAHCSVGLLLNFGPKPERRRIVWTPAGHRMTEQ